MKVTYDSAIDVAYIYFVESIAAGAVAKTYACDPRQVNGQINLDFDSAGRLLGLEVLDASHYLSQSVLHSDQRGEE
jgi:Uncharacterized conserved small protein